MPENSHPHVLDHDVAHWLSHWAQVRPSALAWADDHRRCNYAEAEDRVARLAGWMSDQGIVIGDRIAVWLGNRGATLEAIFAAARLGAIALPVNARLTPDEVAFQFDDCTPKVVIVERSWRERADKTTELLSDANPSWLEIGEASGASGAAASSDSVAANARKTGCAYEAAIAEGHPVACRPNPSADDAMILMYTSGTTGKPKGALLPLRKTLYNCLNAERYFDIRSEDRVLVVAPLFHSLGLQILAIPTIFAGAGLVIQEGFDAVRVWQAIQSEDITYYGGVPTMHQRMLDALDREEPFGTPPACLRFAFTAGAAAPSELIRAYHDRGLAMKQGYGQTETSILTCLDSEQTLTKAGSVGRPVHHATLRLIDPATIEGDVSEWRDVKVGEVGEIVVNGPITMLGYWQRAEATAETIRGDWLRTGDLATQDADLDVTLVGRARDMYISGGENVYPAEVEATLVDHPDIEEAAVISVPDAEWGEIGRAHLVAATGRTLRAEPIAEWLSTRLARYKQPRSFIIETELPRTASGKVQKHRLTASKDGSEDGSDQN